MDFTELLNHLDRKGAAPDWKVRQIVGGANGLIYHAHQGNVEVCVKFSAVDEYDRIGREHTALSVLQELNPVLAPTPLLLDRQSYSQPVIVQSWLKGDVSSTPPETDEAWLNLLEHYAALTQVKPERSSVQLERTVLNASTFEGAKDLVRGQLARLPEYAFPDDVRSLTEQLFAMTLSDWPEAPVAICRGDSNLSNFVRGEYSWSSVDWEYGGWGDPAFEIAEMRMHPAYAAVPSERWPWVAARYCELIGDDHAAERIQAYMMALSVWWTVRFARYLYEVPRGLDPRLASRPENFLSKVEREFDSYLLLARQCLEA